MSQEHIAILESKVRELNQKRYRLQLALEQSVKQKHLLHESLKISVEGVEAALAGKDMDQLPDFEGWLKSAHAALAMSCNTHTAPIVKRAHIPSPDKLWFVYCPENGFTYHTTKDEAIEYGADEIREHLDCDNGWSENVDEVIVGKVVLKSTQYEVRRRPEVLDEEGCDEDGQYWDSDWDYICNYKLLPIGESES